MKDVLITSSVLIVVVLLLRLIFGKKVRRRLIYGAWALVALRLLIPVQLGQLPFSVLNAAKPMTEVITEISSRQVAGVNEQDAYRQVLQDYIEDDHTVFIPEVQEIIQSAKDYDTPKGEIADMVEQAYPEQEIFVPEAQSQVQQEVETSTTSITLGQFVTVFWITGMALMALWLILSNLRLRLSLRKAEPFAADCRLKVFVSEKVCSPCLVGLFRPAIYLTPECVADENLTRYVITHELTHFAHGDHIWSLVRCICLCVYWFNPLVWMAAWVSRRDCEFACDEGALKRLAEGERIAYGNALLQVVSHASISGRLILTATTMAETKRQLKHRVLLIARKPRWSVAAAVCMLIVCLITAGCTATGPLNAEPSEPEDNPSWEVTEEVRSQLKQDYIQFRSGDPHSCTVDHVQLVVISHVKSGYAVVIGCSCTSIKPNASWDDLFGESAGDLTYYMPSGWYMSFCKDGQFQMLDAAFNNGWLTYDELRTVWFDYHAQFPAALETWKTCNPGLSEPPRRDECGLDYVVNRDGFTCTITGMGVCTDAEVVIPEVIASYEVTAIGELAFWAQNITSIVIPDSVVSIERSAFRQCDDLRTVKLGRGLERIGLNAFENCKKLTSISLPEGLTSIGGGAFSNCSSLTSLLIPDGVTSISSGAFNGCTSLKSINIPAGLTAIEDHTFSQCSALTAIHIPDRITSIGEGAFSNCSGLTQVTIPKSVTVIQSGTFAYCTNIRSVLIPYGVTSIEKSAFAGCRRLETVTIPDSVVSIGYWAFDECSGMTGLSIGKSVSSIGFAAFRQCSSVTSLSVASGNPYFSVRGNCLIENNSKTLLLGGKTAVIPDDGSVTGIADYAFFGQTHLREFTVPAGIQSIGTDAFSGCKNLTTIYLPDTLWSISNSFMDCNSLKDIYYSGTKTQWYSMQMGYPIADGYFDLILHCTDAEIKL